MSLAHMVGRRVRVDSVAPIHCDPARTDGILAVADPSTGFLHLEGRTTRTGVFRYRDAEGNEWGELREASEVFHPDSLASFRHVVVTDEHPAEFVTVRNVRDVQVGQVGSDVRPDSDGVHVRAPIVVTDARTILAIQRGKTELSNGYTADLVEDKGDHEGASYQLRQTNIRGNHLAIVDTARGGPSCALIVRGDGSARTASLSAGSPRADATVPRRDGAPLVGDPMKLSQLIKDARKALAAGKFDEAKSLTVQIVAALKVRKDEEGESGGAAGKVTAILELLTAAQESGQPLLVEAALTKVAEMVGGEPSKPAPEPPMPDAGNLPVPPPSPPGFDSGDAVKLRAKVDSLEASRQTDAASFTARVDARVALVAQARAICPTLDATGKSDDDIRRAVVLEVQPELKSKLDANAASSGYLAASYDSAIDLHASRAKHADAIPSLIYEATRDDAEKLPAVFGGFFARLDKKGGVTPRATRSRHVDVAGQRLEKICDSVRFLPQYRVDEREGIFAVQLVRETLRELFRMEYDATRFANGDRIPITSNVNEGATEYAYLEIEHSGRAKIVADNATDIPYAEIGGRNNILPIKTLAVAIQYSTQEVRTAQMQGMFDIAGEKAAAAREAHDQELNDLIRVGFPAAGLYGITNAPGIIVQAAITGGWATATAAQIVADVTAAVNSGINSSNGIEVPDTFLMPLVAWTRISTLQNSAASDITVLQYLRNAFPHITTWDWDAGMSTASSAAGRAALIYKKDARKARVVMPMMLRATPPQQNGLVFEVVFESRFGGVMAPKPRSITRLEGI